MIDESAIKRALALFDAKYANTFRHPGYRQDYENQLRSDNWNQTKAEAMQGYIEEINGGDPFTVEHFLAHYGIAVEVIRDGNGGRCVLSKNSKRFSWEIGAVDRDTALSLLARDMDSYEMWPKFEDWCEALNLNPDSRAYEAAFKTIRARRNRFIAQFGEEAYRVFISFMQEV